MGRIKTASTLGELCDVGERADSETLPYDTLPEMQRRAWGDVEAWYLANPEWRDKRGGLEKALAATDVAKHNYFAARRKMERVSAEWARQDMIRPGDKILRNVRERVQAEEDAKTERETRIEKSYKAIAKAAVPDELPAEMRRDIRIQLDPANAVDFGKCEPCPERGTDSECSLDDCPPLVVTPILHPPEPEPPCDLATLHKILDICRPLDKTISRRVLRAAQNMLGVDD